MHYGIAYIALCRLSKAAVGVLSKCQGQLEGAYAFGGYLTVSAGKVLDSLVLSLCSGTQHIQFYWRFQIESVCSPADPLIPDHIPINPV